MTQPDAPDPRGTADTHVTHYRRDIDGLRAVAVIAIIVFHFRREWLPLGYLGVDIFFVISGFLITTIVAREVREKRFSLWRFYERRLRRIAPALIVMLAATSMAAVVILLPVDLIGYGRSLIATLTFVSNIYFWRDTDYFSRAAEEKPLLHTWSLSIEEQFYLFFPLLLAFGWRWMGGRVRHAVAVATLASLVLYLATLRFGAVIPAFYLLPTRAWELGAGATLALYAPRTGKRWIGSAGGIAGFIVMAVTIVGGWGLEPNLGISELLAVGGATLLIWSGRAGGVMARLLGAPALVRVGQLSYSAYLWHWPLIVFVRYVLVRDPTVAELIGLFVLLLAVSELSYRLVEQPARQRTADIGTIARRAAAGAAALAAFALFLMATAGLPARMDPAAARANAVVNTMYRCGLSDYVLFGASRGCVMQLPSRHPADADVVLLGNSHAMMYTPAIAEVLRARHQTGLLVPAVGCFPTDRMNISRECMRVAAENIAATAALARARTVIVAFDWALDKPLIDAAGTPITTNRLNATIAAVDRTILRLQRAGKRVVLVGPIAPPGWDVASIVSRARAFGRPIGHPLFVARATAMEPYAALFEHYGKRRDIVFVRPDSVQCATGECRYIDDQGTPIFADSNHLAVTALPAFTSLFAHAIR